MVQTDDGAVGFFDGEVLGRGIRIGDSIGRSMAWRLGAFDGL